MDVKRLRVLATALAMAAAGGCGGGGAKQTYPDASLDLGPGPGPADTAPQVEVAPRPTPEMGAGSRRLFQVNEAVLIGGGDSCTNQVPASGDRWCAFTLPSTFLNRNDLWVINVTKAIANTAIACTGADPNCVRLTQSLYSEPVTGSRPDFSIHGFDGDTLIYYAENTSASGFVGPVFAWRPGWTAPRKLTTNAGVLCSGHPTAAVAVCLQNFDTTTVMTQASVDLTAGKIQDADGLLPKVETMLYDVMTDAAAGEKFGFSLTLAGDSVAWSTRTTAAGPEILKIQKLNDDATRKVVAENVTRWQMSADSTKWFWLKAFNHDTMGNDAGTLEMAPFPDGTAPTVLMAGVSDFTTSGAKGIILRSGLTMGIGELKMFQDYDNVAATTKVLDTGVLGVWDVSRDGKAILYSKMFSGALEQLFDLHINTVSLGTPCVAVGTPLAAPLGTFSETGQTAVWARRDPASMQFHGHYTNVSTCASSKYASNIIGWTAIRDEGYIYMDDQFRAEEATIRFNQVTNATFPAMGTLVQTRAVPLIATLLPTHPVLVYTVVADPDKNGIYINTALPFTAGTPVPPPADGGAGN